MSKELAVKCKEKNRLGCACILLKDPMTMRLNPPGRTRSLQPLVSLGDSECKQQLRAARVTQPETLTRWFLWGEIFKVKKQRQQSGR